VKDLENLNIHQRQAVEQVNGRVLILAGAGSGKTRVLTTRMAYLIQQLNVSPKSILGLTFTNKAAAEMRYRLATLIEPQAAKQVCLCTFHSFCMQLLRNDIHHLGYTSAFTLYDEQDVQRLMNAIVRDHLQHVGDLPSLGSTVEAIKQAKYKGGEAETITGTASKWHDGFAQEVYSRLKASMRAYNAVDFDHLLSLTVEIFERFPQVLEKYQERYRYIMIDEYQDTNPIQYKLASLLSKKYQNLCVVGDDDQSIYGWRGADIKNILDFDNALVIKMEQNYRSSNTILSAANAVIKNNSQRHIKNLWSDKGCGQQIEIFHAPDEVKEAEAVIKKLIRLKNDEKLAWKDIAILYRSNALSRQFELILMKSYWQQGERWVQGIPYEIWGGTEFFDRKEVKDLCAYLRFIINPLDQDALLRIINQPTRGIGEDSLDQLTSHNRQKDIPLSDVLQKVINQSDEVSHLKVSAKALKGITHFTTLIQEARVRFNAANLTETLKWLIDSIDYQRAIREEVKSQTMRDLKWDNVQEFVSSLAQFESRCQEDAEQECSLINFISTLGLDRQQMHTQSKENADKVKLMTFHSSKGLEFPVCFLVGIEDHIIPHEKSMAYTGIEEERRLMYVAITRAKKHLIISMAQRRMRMGKETSSRPSRFLYEIPKELIKMIDWRTIY